MKNEINAYITATMNIYERTIDYSEKQGNKSAALTLTAVINDLTDLLDFVDLQEESENLLDINHLNEYERNKAELEAKDNRIEEFEELLEVKDSWAKALVARKEEQQLKIAELEACITKWATEANYKAERVRNLEKELKEYQDRCKRANI